MAKIDLLFWAALLPTSAHAAPLLKQLRHDNPPLEMLLSQLDKLRLQLDDGGCDYFGEHDPGKCKEMVDKRYLRQAVSLVDAPPSKHVYCINYNAPVSGSATDAPISGFKCWKRTVGELALLRSLELVCQHQGWEFAKAKPSRLSCKLEYTASNQDEDIRQTYSFLIDRAKIDEARGIGLSYKTNN